MDRRSNLAYDYSHFEQSAEAAQEKPTIQEVRKKQLHDKTISAAKSVGYIAMAVIMLSIVIYGRATQAELEADYAATVKEINRVTNDNIILQNQLESKLSLKNIEEIAKNELGLTKVDNSQIECINFNLENKAEIIKKQSIWSTVSNWFTGLFN